MKREFSAGGIVLRPASQGEQAQNKWEVLLTQHSSNKYWGFPRGNIDQGETSQDAALREVKEEAGVEAEILQKVGDSQYVYFAQQKSPAHTHPQTKERIFKIVTIYLMRYLSGDPQDHDWEVLEAGWFTPEEALKILSFSQDKSLLKKALEML